MNGRERQGEETSVRCDIATEHHWVSRVRACAFWSQRGTEGESFSVLVLREGMCILASEGKGRRILFRTFSEQRSSLISSAQRSLSPLNQDQRDMRLVPLSPLSGVAV